MRIYMWYLVLERTSGYRSELFVKIGIRLLLYGMMWNYMYGSEKLNTFVRFDT